MLTKKELNSVFKLGKYIFILGVFVCVAAVIPRHILWNWGLNFGILGFSLCVSAIFIYLYQINLEDDFYCEEDESPQNKQTVIPSCCNCKYFHGRDFIHCAVHPCKKDFKACRDYEN